MNLQQLRLLAVAWWARLAAREKTLLATAAWLLLVALLWSLAVAPALVTLRSFDAKRAALEQQVQRMLQLAAQARALQAQPVLPAGSAPQALQATVTKAFGNQAELVFAGGSATVTLHNVRDEVLAQWLVSARVDARATPAQARLTRTSGGWNGSLQMGLPAS